MGDILSQNEIDELLKSLSSGDPVISQQDEIKEAKNYNFARPSKFNKEQLRSLEIVFDNYSRMLSSFLTGYLRTTVHVELANAEQATYSEFNNLLINPVILSIVEFAPLKGSLILEMSASIGYTIIDRILGGPGIGIKKIRDFSDLEKILLERVIVQLLIFIPETWENIAEIKPRLDKIETNSQFAQIISPNEMTALVTLTIKIGSIEGMINFCIPYIVIEPIMDRLNTKYWFSMAEDEEQSANAEHIETQLSRAEIQIAAIIGKTTINVNDFINLQVGDIIPLDSYVNSDLNILVGDCLKFKGKPGISRGKNAVQVTSFVEKEE
ncbi:MAG: flagellar motor switch protein FliM [Clostridiales bacterium]|jgi:flagellar motor switch protein FliM|nr:flagellar motor switch protein FliM [Clostridiales bacterium]